jgi:hypothetical protein
VLVSPCNLQQSLLDRIETLTGDKVIAVLIINHQGRSMVEREQNFIVKKFFVTTQKTAGLEPHRFTLEYSI